MNAFGGRFDEPELTDQIDDDYDVVNDETFGGAVPADEWEADQIAEELEAAEAAVVAAAAEKSILEFAASRLPISDDPLEFLRDDILQLVEEDDDVPIGLRKKTSTGTKPFIFAPGSPQTPFFQLDQGSRNIWSDSLPPSVRSAPSTSSPAVTGLLERMRVNGGGSFGLPAEPGPVLVKGAKTAEELEAEMLGKPAATTAPPKFAAGPAIKSCAELERELIESSRNAAAAAAGGVAPSGMVKPPLPGVGPGVDIQQPMPTMPGMPQIPNILMRPPPQHPLANPQVRAAMMARWMAANPGAPPPVWFRMPPPPMMPPPHGAGFRPPITIRPGPNMPPMNFNNARMPQNMDPRAIGLMLQHGGVRRPMPQNFPKRRLFDSPGRFGNDHYEQRHRDRDRDRDYYHHNRDPFAGLMTRRERSWLIKIQTLQLHSENPYVDDYYWMMYRRRKMTNDGTVYKDTDHNDNFEHRVYVPPSFEGTLGKVQVLSANFPRQVLDLAASAANGDKQSTEESSPRDSPPVTKSGQPVVAGRRLKHILIEIENLYLMVLEANDLTMVKDPIASADMTEDAREKAAVRAKSLVQSVLSTLITEDRIVSTLAVRKGRRLLAQLTPHCEKDDCLKIMQAISRNLSSLSKKEPHQEVLATIKLMLDAKLSGTDETDEAGWSIFADLIARRKEVS